jgi:tetrapyrrole methylase family protein/MazG family protein/ATP diphosphatase
MPSLPRAQQLSSRVARVGFDWPDAAGSRGKVDEELAELDEAVKTKDPERMQQELGDVLFALVNFARHIGIDADSALRGTCDRFSRRFAGVERRVIEKHGGWPSAEHGSPLTLAELDEYWEMSKREES